jgi:nucleoside-diphosphate-sugar epimerase
MRNILVTGGAGYVGSVLVPKLLGAGFSVKVLDTYYFGRASLAAVRGHENLMEINGDIRDQKNLERSLSGIDAVIHLACISNDPSFELDPELGKSINYDAFIELVRIAKDKGVRRFVYASSSSVYGLKNDAEVTEDLQLQPMTDYSKFKALCEEHLDKARGAGFTTLTIRPATICGYAPRLRLDLTVNILTNHAINNGKITVFGGEQLRPNLHIQDMTDLYVKCLGYDDDLIDGRIFNAGYQNYKVIDIAHMIRNVIGRDFDIEVTPTDDHRSYHISSERITSDLGFVPRCTVEDAIRDLGGAFHAGIVPNPMTNDKYYNIKTMQRLGLA